MINTPVHAMIDVDEDDNDFLTGDVYDAGGDYLFSTENETTVKELVKRINMHDELVELLKESKYAISETYGIDSVFVDRVNNALERCK